MAGGARISSTTSRVLKALGIFGGVQVLTILCSVARNKMAALWIGPEGVGLLAIYVSTFELLCLTAQLNLNQSAVRELSLAKDGADRGARMLAVVRKTALFLAIAGALAMIVLSPLVSMWAFGDRSHALSFAVLALPLFAIISTSPESAAMRAYDRLKPLAKCNIYTAVLLMVVAGVLFYFLRLEAVVPVVVIGQLMTAAFVYHYRLKDIPRERVTLREARDKGRSMMALGFYMTVSTFVTQLASNAFVIYLNRQFSESSVGIYQAGYALINTYVGLIFTAIAMEYYPRLSAVGEHRRRIEIIVSHEMKIALWVLMPVAVGFVCLSRVVVHLLYSASFDGAVPFVVIGATGVFFRAASWCIAYTILARGDGRMFVFTEVLSSLVYLALYIPLYNAFGYLGLGVGYVAWYFIYLLIVYAVYRLRYGLRLRKGIVLLLGLSLVLAALLVTGYYSVGPWWTLLILLPPTAYGAVRNIFGSGCRQFEK